VSAARVLANILRHPLTGALVIALIEELLRLARSRLKKGPSR
jgi:hypothetical protein